MPYLFEDPFPTSEIQLVGIWHQFPGRSAFRGGYAAVAAVQARLALTDRLSFIATKDGLTFLRPQVRLNDVAPGLGGGALLEDQEGSMDMTLGLKYALISRPEDGFILSPSLRFETDFGSHDLLQGRGDGIVIPALSFGWGSRNLHLLGGLGGQLPLDRDHDSTSIFYNLHVDYAVPVEHPGGNFIAPFLELNGMHWTRSGDGSAPVQTTLGRLDLSTAQVALRTGAFEGYDVANLGSAGIAGANLVTMAVGVRIPIREGATLGISYERPVSERKDIIKQRLTLMMSYGF